MRRVQSARGVPLLLRAFASWRELFCGALERGGAIV